MKYKGIIFDLDGTLIDTLADIARVANTILQTHGFPRHETEDYKTMIGMGMRNLVFKALPSDAGGDDGLVETCVAELIEAYRENPVLLSRPYPGIPEVLSELSGNGVPMAVLSNKEDGLTRQVMAELLPVFEFRHIQGDIKGVPRKPNPESALSIARSMGLNPEEIILLGDSGSDMETAVNAGMAPIGALWGFRPGEELEAGGAKYLCETPADITNYV